MKHEINETLAKNKGEASLSSKTPKNKNIDEYLAAMAGFESDRISLAKSSAKKAWQVAFGFAVIAGLSIIAVVVLAPLKTVEPYVVRVDDATGAVKILRPLVEAESITYGEVLDKYWSRKFITARNSYNWETIQDNFNLVRLMGNRTVFTTYSTSVKSLKSPVNLFSDKKRIKIDIEDVSFLPNSDDTITLAQVRFSREVINITGKTDPEYDITFWNATITFDYLAEINTADERTLNPLGYRVTSYSEERVFKQ